MNQKKEYFTPDFEVFNFVAESILNGPSSNDTTTTTRPDAPELPDDGFGGIIVF